MPGFDGTGPRGKGSMIGGGRGVRLSGRGHEDPCPYRLHRGLGGSHRYQETALPDVPDTQKESISSLRDEIRSLSEKVAKLAFNSKKEPDDS
ncbi:MAG: DUF5320 domain-containing protein [Deltaproteobacteria bacterium]|nr:DUF5320 domain-containing protein [Deltaproteobacteria bacterium]